VRALWVVLLAGCSNLSVTSGRPVAADRSARTCTWPIVASLTASASTIAGTRLIVDGVAAHTEAWRERHLEVGIPILMLGIVAATATVYGFSDCR
jgi:hypothetical protein